jgi:hypothetical protein
MCGWTSCSSPARRDSAVSSSFTAPGRIGALIIVEGHHESAARDAAAAIGDLTRLLGAGGVPRRLPEASGA